MSTGAQNLKIGPNALGTAKNEFRSAKHANETRRPQYHPKLVRERKTWKRNPRAFSTPENETWAQNMKMGSDALCTSETESGSAKHET
jgi:hypothetical protein